MKFVHVNIVARDWKCLATFYQSVFGCEPLLPERHLSGDWLERASGLSHPQIDGIHLRLPGYGENGPTLEIFQYAPESASALKKINQPGLAHIAFAVDDVLAVREAVLAAGGTEVGEIIDVQIPGAGMVTFVYLADPEGNIVELQRWGKLGHSFLFNEFGGKMKFFKSFLSVGLFQSVGTNWGVDDENLSFYPEWNPFRNCRFPGSGP